MIGHLPLIKLRMRGITPSAVWVHDYLTPVSKDWSAPVTLSGKPMKPHYPSVSIEPKDAIRSLDLRFLVGVEVYTSSSDEKRAKALFEACKRSGATLVVGCHTQDDKHYTEQAGWAEIWRKDGVSN